MEMLGNVENAENKLKTKKISVKWENTSINLTINIIYSEEI